MTVLPLIWVSLLYNVTKCAGGAARMPRGRIAVCMYPKGAASVERRVESCRFEPLAADRRSNPHRPDWPLAQLGNNLSKSRRSPKRRDEYGFRRCGRSGYLSLESSSHVLQDPAADSALCAHHPRCSGPLDAFCRPKPAPNSSAGVVAVIGHEVQLTYRSVRAAWKSEFRVGASNAVR